MDISSNPQIPKYDIEKPIGQGGMGVIYVAISKAINQRVALKLLDTREVGGEHMVQRFQQEGRIIASLQHPNIIRLHEIGVSGHYLYIAMEYLPGGDLRHKLARKRIYSSVRTLNLLIQITKALRYAHRSQILHRDIRPANILFRANKSAVLTDFGSAKIVATDHELTLPGRAVGSPKYLSPEQVRGEPLDVRSDIYSLGIVAYEMLTGNRPYEAENFVDIARQHLYDPLPRLPDSLVDFQGLLDRMLAKSCEERFRNTEELIQHLKIIKPQIISEKPDMTKKSKKKWFPKILR